jgi:hypothetical protein
MSQATYDENISNDRPGQRFLLSRRQNLARIRGHLLPSKSIYRQAPGQIRHG